MEHASTKGPIHDESITNFAAIFVQYKYKIPPKKEEKIFTVFFCSPTHDTFVEHVWEMKITLETGMVNLLWTTGSSSKIVIFLAKRFVWVSG